ncbi:baseplate wedge subunit protein [Rhizobium phage RHEph12]|nr:baseplate wedge subunit protein [Rhizobium phage RHEph12]
MATSNTISRLAEKVVDDLYTEYPSLFVTLSRAAYINSLQQALNDIVQTDIDLGTTTPDYESVSLRLIQALSGIPGWYDLITPATSAALVRTISSGIAYGQFSIERAYQEAFLGTASSDSGVYSGVRMLGIRPQRRQPSRATVQLNRQEATTILTIPAYSIFTIGEMKFFNRDTIVFNLNVFSVTKQLFQGVVQTEVITSDGEPFQKYTVGDGEANASDIDVFINIDGVTWERSIDGLQQFGREEAIYNENTAQNGDIEISFGNGDYGRVPPLSSAINITWVKTLGKDADVSSSGIAVKMDNPPVNTPIDGITLTNIENGGAAITPKIYKKIAPSLYASQGRAVTRADYAARAVLFPGVYDALFQGQAELAPGRRSMMNVIGYTILTDSNWTLDNFKNFEDKFKQDWGIYQCQFLRIPPIPVIQNVKATVYCNPDADLQQTYDILIANLNKLYTPRVNYIGRNIYLSDISDVLNGRDPDNPNERLEIQTNYVLIDTTVTQNAILTNKRQYVVQGTVSVTMAYTSRDGYAGRLDISPNQADTTVVT